MFLDSGKCLDAKMCFWFLGRVFDSGKCFWILGRVVDPGKCLDFGTCFGFWEVFCPHEPP